MIHNLFYRIIIIIILQISISCKSDRDLHTTNNKVFYKVPEEVSSIHFENRVKENLYFNFLNYPYIYNGGGVAVGDINNDGLPDLYFTSNQESNILYLNKGNFLFEDITISAKVQDTGGWSTGVTMIDVNQDGYLDIYVCKSGSLKSHELRKNKLFINQQNNTFKESAKTYGIDHFGFSVQAYFFDFDLDNDLDLYLVNHRQDFRNNVVIDKRISENIQDFNSDQLFRNDNGFYINVTKEAGVANKAWGLSASIGDFNQDNLPDIFVANDFLEPDYLYINKGDGTFENEIDAVFKHISNNSMGSDFADINNDLKGDLIVLDMMAEDHIRGKENMATMSTENFWELVSSGYHYQYMSNMLQLNNGDGTFSEIGQLAGVAKTDWSWAPLLADFDNDGYNDIFITNGIERDLSNQDFRNQLKTNIQNRKKVKLEEAIGMMPSNKLSNYIFKNNKDLTFSNKTVAWGLDEKINSNGAVYADLDLDGDLDLIINNQGEKAEVYKNNSTNNFISFLLKGPEKNRNGVGTRITVFSKDLQQVKELQNSRGFQSSVENKLVFGLGRISNIDSVQIRWPDGKTQVQKELLINKHHTISYVNSTKLNLVKQTNKPEFQNISAEKLGVNFQQKENNFNDYDLQLLLPQKQSEMSTPLVVGDVNGDGLDDFFAGNSRGNSASLYLQNKNGEFIESNVSLFQKEKMYEDTDAVFLDVDNDKDLDLYVCSGGYEVSENNVLLQDRLYVNNGKGVFSKSENISDIRVNSKGITTADFDKDGDVDVFVGSRVIHGKYPISNDSYLLENKNGNLVDVTKQKFENQNDIQMVNDVLFTDFDKDGDVDLLVVGEWMSVAVFENINNKFTIKKIPELIGANGWYQSISEMDIDNDGYKDYIIGNWGLNNKFQPSKEKPLHIYSDYFDANKTYDVVLSKVSKKGELLPVRGKQCSTQQVPSLQKNIKSYKQFASLSLGGIYGETTLKKAVHFTTHTLETKLLRNNKGKSFEWQALPKQVQFGPSLGTEVADVNNDGYKDIIGVGTVYEAEVETIRYDASKGYVLLGDENGQFTYKTEMSGFTSKQSKAIQKISIKGEDCFLLLNKNSKIEVVKFINK
ncbi:VCBS repeat-containing protein [Bacteroidota bacterium]